MPTQDDVLGYFTTLSNWGRWGDDDELGTLNHITDDVRLDGCRARPVGLHLAVAPVRFAGTSGSPVNPIATF